MSTSVASREAVVQKLIALAAAQTGVDADEISAETHLFNDLNFDSLDAVEYTMSIEEEFEVDIPDEQAQQVFTIRDAADMLLGMNG